MQYIWVRRWTSLATALSRSRSKQGEVGPRSAPDWQRNDATRSLRHNARARHRVLGHPYPHTGGARGRTSTPGMRV
jgi:hypothetical protein